MLRDMLGPSLCRKQWRKNNLWFENEGHRRGLNIPGLAEA